MRDAYDSIPFPGATIPETHPDRLATIAHLLGMEPADPTRCRVLELGCGDGGNLVSLAYLLPGGTFVGIDRAGEALARGQALARATGLRNMSLERMDLLDATGELGTFDYIIAHGVFSWVPEPVRSKILQICRVNLAPQGVAFISYLVLPGNHLRDVFRDIMLFHVRGREDPAERAVQARAILRFIADGSSEDDDAYQRFARSLIDELDRADDGVILHDLLAEHNAAYSFAHFANLAASHGLQFLSEADYATGFHHGAETTPAFAAALRQLSRDPLLREQYMDFLCCRRYRQSLLCHAEVRLDRDVQPSRLRGLCVSAALPDSAAEGDVELRFDSGAGAMAVESSTRAALERVAAAWPAAIPIDSLPRELRGVGGGLAVLQEERLALRAALLRAYERGAVELWTQPPRITTTVSERPCASALAREQLRTGSVVSNLRQRSLRVEDAVVAHLIGLLDGTRDRAALTAALAEGACTGVVRLASGGVEVRDRAEAASLIAARLDDDLRGIARSALLVA